MTREEARALVKKRILEQVKLPPEEFRFDMSLKDELALESFLLADLLWRLEDDFGTEISPEVFPYLFTPEDLAELAEIGTEAAEAGH